MVTKRAKRIAIIGGAGKMGRWFASFLLRDGKEVAIADSNRERLLEAGKQLAVQTMSNAEAVRSADAVLISVPIDSFEEVVEQIHPYTHAGQLIMDVTSVKAFPVEVMHRYIRAGLVLGAHPMFGPGARDISNKNFILTPTSEDETTLAQEIGQYLKTRGARVSLMAPGEHDEMMTMILGLPSLVAMVSADTLLSFDKFKLTRAISGSTYRLLLMLAESVVWEDPELYASLQMSLPDMVKTEDLFLSKAREWEGLVKDKDKQGFIRRANSLRDGLQKANSGFGKAYEDMYKMVEGL
jgi:prephenate dehydrogenase